ncbi:MAG: ABC transporter substrate-binding protein [Bacillota bacterium]
MLRSKLMATLIIIVMAAVLITGCSQTVAGRPADKSFTLYVGHVSASLPATYMPWLSNADISTTLASLVYDTLFNYDDETDQFTGRLAKNWSYVVPPERVSDSQDYLEVRVELDPSAKWSDGKPVTAKDIYFTLDLAADFGRTNHAGALAWIGDLRHTYTRNASGGYALSRQGVFYKDKPGSYTFKEGEENVVYLHVRKVLGAITPLFTTITILPEHKWNVISPSNQLNTTDPVPAMRSLYNNPVGSGPYTIDTANSNSSIVVLNKRTDYHLRDKAGKDLYKPDKIKVINYMDINVAINALKKGDIDVINSTVDSAYVENLTKEPGLKLDFAAGVFAQTLVLNLNPPDNFRTPERATLAIPEVRTAIALAIDQKNLIDSVLRGRGAPVPAGLVAGFEPFYNPNVVVTQPNINEATRLLESIGYTLQPGQKIRSKDGVKLSYKVSGSVANRNLINYLKVQLEKVGIEVEFEDGGSNAVKDRYYTGNFDMTIQGVIFRMTNVDMMMTAHFMTIGSSSNYGRLVDPRLAAKIEEMRTTLNSASKIILLKDIQKLVADLHYKIPLYSAEIISVYRTDIYEGWTTANGSSIFNTDTLQNLKFKSR